MPEGGPAASGGGSAVTARVTGLISGPSLRESLGGYASIEMLGQSQALGEGPGAAASAAALEAATRAGAAAAVKDIPGIVPGAKSEGWLQLDLSDRPAAAMAGKNAGFFYVHVRAVHTGTEVVAGPGYEALQHGLREQRQVVYDPAFVNDPRKPRR